LPRLARQKSAAGGTAIIEQLPAAEPSQFDTFSHQGRQAACALRKFGIHIWSLSLADLSHTGLGYRARRLMQQLISRLWYG
jgi:hypothetical protein